MLFYFILFHFTSFKSYSFNQYSKGLCIFISKWTWSPQYWDEDSSGCKLQYCQCHSKKKTIQDVNYNNGHQCHSKKTVQDVNYNTVSVTQYSWHFAQICHLLLLNTRPTSPWWRLTLLVHAGLFWCFQNPPNSDMDYRISNMRMWSFCMHIHPGDLGLYSLIRKDFCRACTEFDSREISGQAQSELAHNGHPSIWWPYTLDCA